MSEASWAVLGDQCDTMILSALVVVILKVFLGLLPSLWHTHTHTLTLALMLLSLFCLLRRIEAFRSSEKMFRQKKIS